MSVTEAKDDAWTTPHGEGFSMSQLATRFLPYCHLIASMVIVLLSGTSVQCLSGRMVVPFSFHARLAAMRMAVVLGAGGSWRIELFALTSGDYVSRSPGISGFLPNTTW